MTYRKFHNKPTEVDGIRFDSKKEAKRYTELRLLEKAGEVMEIELQPKFPLAINGVKIGTYIADFLYWTASKGYPGKKVVEDVKGIKTPVYRLKKKLVWALYGIEIQEV